MTHATSWASSQIHTEITNATALHLAKAMASSEEHREMVNMSYKWDLTAQLIFQRGKTCTVLNMSQWEKENDLTVIENMMRFIPIHHAGTMNGVKSFVLLVCKY